MAQTVIIQLTDDLDGGVASETIVYSLDGIFYEIDLNAENAASFRELLRLYISKSRTAGKATNGTRRPRNPGAPSSPAKTLFSQLSEPEKERFRAWAQMPTARRIGDHRVQRWIEAGRP
jgi:hypothetical protein